MFVKNILLYFGWENKNNYKKPHLRSTHSIIFVQEDHE